MNKTDHPNAKAVEQAIKSAAQNRCTHNKDLVIGDVIRQAYFDRFLCRVFSSEPATWVLKGGTAMLARVPDTRRTTDIDMYNSIGSVDSALQDLQKRALIDLGDFFSFQFRSAQPIPTSANQPYLNGLRVTFDITLGVQPKGQIKVDLVNSLCDTDLIDELHPLNRLSGLDLPTYPYRVFPLANQIADKVCAIEGTYSGQPSSRSKDLVDLVVIATTQSELDATDTAEAISSERSRRGHDSVPILAVPDDWTSTYQSIAARVPACSKFQQFEGARELMRSFIDPVLQGTAKGTWSPRTLTWVDT